jgi:WD40 repeat protein/serine/threonine protein kinase
MTDPAVCPDLDRLSALLAGGLTEPEQAALARHLDGCEACQQTLQQLASDGEAWLETARRLHAVQAAGPPGPGLRRVLDAFQGPDGPERTQADTADTHDDELGFLGPPREAGHLGRLGHYEVLEVVGRGGMGIVLKAFDEALHRVVAIKVLAPQLAAVGSARRRFNREARAAAAVSHDHVVPIYAIEEASEPPYLVMQFVAGRSLQERIDRTGPLELKEVLRIGMQAAQGLAAAHAQGLVHRDVKPANILLENGVERVKLTDFGLARAADDASVTASGVIAGTPQYMAPEQARGEAVDHRADLFSLGSVLYAMCTGRPPFRASTTMGVIRLVSEQPATPVREINPDVPECLVAVIERLHAKDPARRYQSAAEVAEVLGRLLAQAQQPGGLPRTVPPPRHLPGPCVKVLAHVLAALFVGGLLLLSLFLAVALHRWSVGPLKKEAAGVPDPAALQPGPPAQAEGPVRELRGHTGWVISVALSPDGRQALSGSHDRTMRLWDVRTGREVHRFKDFGEWVEAVAFSPDGRQALSGCADHTMRLWEVATGQELKCFRGHTAGVRAVAFSPDGRRALSGGKDGTVRLWDATTGKEVRRFEGHGNQVESVAFVPGGRQVLSGGWDQKLRLWDVETGHEVRQFEGHTSGVESVAVSDDGRLALSGGGDATVRLWDLESGKELRQFTGHRGAVNAVAFCLGGRGVLSAGRDGTVRQWERDSGRECRRFVGHAEWVFSVACTPDGPYALSGGGGGLEGEQPIPGKDFALRLWRLRPEKGPPGGSAAPKVPAVRITPEPPPAVPAGAPLNDLALVSRPAPVAGVQSWTVETAHHRAAVEDVAYSPDGRWLATACRGGAVRIWESATRRLVRVLVPPSTTARWLRGLAWSPDSRYLATCHNDVEVELWEVSTGRQVRTLRGEAKVYTVAWSPDGRFLAGVGWASPGVVQVWDVASGGQPRLLKGHTGSARGLAWSPDGKKLASGGDDKTAIVWDVVTGRPHRKLEGHSGPVKAVAFSPDGAHLATAGFDRTVRIWSIDLGACAHTLTGHTGEVWAVAFSPDGKRLASGGTDHRVLLWGADSGKQLRALEGHTHIVGGLSWSPDSQTLASASWDTTVWLWPAGGGAGHSLPGGTQWAFNLPQWAPDGKHLATGAVNGRVWAAATGQLLYGLPEHVGVVRAGSPDSITLAVADWKGQVWLWDARARRPLRSLWAHEKPVRGAAWSPDGKLLATQDEEGRLLLWDVAGGGGWTELAGRRPALDGERAVAFSADGATLASAGADGQVFLWDVKGRKVRDTRDLHRGRVRALAWSPRRRVVASGGADKVVRVWEADTGKVLQTLTGYPGEVWSLAFSPDGKTLAAAGGWGEVQLYDADTGRQLRPLHGATVPLLSLTWSPDGKRLAGGGELATTHVWDVETGTAAAVFFGLPRDRALAVGATGHYRCTPGVEQDLVYVVRTERGQETLTPPEFAQKYGWKNDPERVRPAGQ